MEEVLGIGMRSGGGAVLLRLVHPAENLGPCAFPWLQAIAKSEHKARIIQGLAAKEGGGNPGLLQEGLNLGFELMQHHEAQYVGFILHCKEDLSHLRLECACRIVPTWKVDI